MLPTLLSPRFTDARTAYWALGQPGVESVEVGGVTKIRFADGASSAELASTLTKLQGRDYIWVYFGGIEVWEAGQLRDPMAFAEVLRTLGSDGKFEGLLRRGASAEAHGGLLGYAGDAQDCPAEVNAELRNALEFQGGWQDLGLYCPEQDYLVRLDESDRAAAALDLLDANGAELAAVLIDLSEAEDRLDLTVANPADFETVRDAYLAGLGTSDWSYFRLSRGVDGVSIQGTEDARPALEVADRLTAAGVEPTWITTDLADIRLIDDGLDDLTAVSEIVPSTAELDIRRPDSSFYLGSAAELPAVGPTLLTIERSGTTPHWSASDSRLRLTTPWADYACDQETLSCAELAAAIASLPGPVTVEAGRQQSRTVFVCRPGEPAEVTEDGNNPFADELIAAWNALA